VTSPTPDLPVLQASDLCKSYGGLRAVDGVSFDVRGGEIVGLVGPNGAGKTTIINMILGVLEPTSGRILIEGLDVARKRSEALSPPSTRRCPAT
jgi:ABC-2 type transport system ATP-binding protein